MKHRGADQWTQVKESFRVKELELGPVTAHLFLKRPEIFLQLLTAYKFVSKMVKRPARVLDLAAEDGWGTWLLAKECGEAGGILSQENLGRAERNFRQNDGNVEFYTSLPRERDWTAYVHLNLLAGDKSTDVLSELRKVLEIAEGKFFFGMPNTFLGTVSFREIQTWFDQNFGPFVEQVFCFNGSAIHTGFIPMAESFIIVGTRK